MGTKATQTSGRTENIDEYCRLTGVGGQFIEGIGLFGYLKNCRQRKSKIFIDRNNFRRQLASRLGFRVYSEEQAGKIALEFLALQEIFNNMHQKGMPVYLFQRIEGRGRGQYLPSAQRRMENRLSFPVMIGDIPRHEAEFKELIGDKYSPEYVKALQNIPQIIRRGETFGHEDCQSELINVVGGKRIVPDAPENAALRIHVYGRCGAFGYAVEDKDTLPNRLQLELTALGYSVKVINHGLWGAGNDYITCNLAAECGSFKQGDMVLFYINRFRKEQMEYFGRQGLRYFNITDEYHAYPESKWCFYDRPGHMNKDGYRIAAEIIAGKAAGAEFLPGAYQLNAANKVPAKYINALLAKEGENPFQTELKDYLEKLKIQCAPIVKDEKYGAIIMNCNPFTLGHRGLIEYAAGQVDRLYIFVVEEDKSFFKFEDRFYLVKAGTADLANVKVLPSGRFMISSLTFPEYFMKDYVKSRQIDVTKDLATFCTAIGPALNISVRFAGEEPFDPVTDAYNENMRQMLPQYGISFVEIPRYALGEDIISATKVREHLKAGNYQKMREYIPESTYQLLREKYTSVT